MKKNGKNLAENNFRKIEEFCFWGVKLRKVLTEFQNFVRNLALLPEGLDPLVVIKTIYNFLSPNVQ